MNPRDQLLGRVKSADARSAFEYLEAEARTKGLAINYNAKKYCPAVEFRENGRYVFAWIPNQGDLLFYIRRPALNVAPHLDAKARRLHPDQYSTNRVEEAKVRIRNRKEAEVLAGWLFDELPLPPPVRRRRR